MSRIAYLGPPGTFTEEALMTLPEAEGAELVPLATVPDVVDAVALGEASAGLVPIENSIEGSVNVTLDALAFGDRIQIRAEVVRRIRHALLSVDGATLGGITDIASHPHATAQCREYLARAMPAARVHAANSTAEAARDVAERGDVAWAAIGTELAGKLYGLVVLAPEIEDRSENATRFVLIGKSRADATGSDKTSVVCFIEKDRPGSLLAILHEFSDRQINLTKLESRPTKERLGEYCFFIDMEGHADEPPVRYAIESLRTKILEVKVLGSYPRARTSTEPDGA
ncbi:MAG TPA: prephenate dehydratase [Actinomycetota bacterium]|nr:prephenate dehydratase [Actinomycetota bacterium]